MTVNRLTIARGIFTVNQVALGFINAVKRQAIEDCDQYITSYSFTDTEYADDPIRIRVYAAAGAPDGQLVRCNIIYAIKTLAIDLIALRRPYGVEFSESYRGQLLYFGVFDNKNDGPSLEQSSNSSALPSETFARAKRAQSAHSLDASNSSTTLLNIPGSDDVVYRVAFEFQGSRVLKISIFSAILELMMTIAQLDDNESIENLSQATSTDSSWIFVMHNLASHVPLQGFQLVAILESIARHVVGRARYQEMTFHFLVNEELVAKGCVTERDLARAWCQGMMEGGQQSLVGNFSSLSSGSGLN